ncbi:MAG: hypothetical protein IJD83_01430 [Clostridia bacterium]|nr:hypothetical protein [Clostridia bacterium]
MADIRKTVLRSLFSQICAHLAILLQGASYHFAGAVVDVNLSSMLSVLLPLMVAVACFLLLTPEEKWEYWLFVGCTLVPFVLVMVRPGYFTFLFGLLNIPYGVGFNYYELTINVFITWALTGVGFLIAFIVRYIKDVRHF